MFSVIFGALFASTLITTPAFANEEDAKLVAVRVLDTMGNPIPNAWVRLPETEGRRMVDEFGKWQAKSLYELDGNELFFLRGMTLDFTISAPGYTSRSVAYEVQKRRNLITVSLQPMTHKILEEGEDNDLMIRWFQRTYVEEEE